MKNFALALFFVLMITVTFAQDAPAGWGIVASWTIPGKASGLAWDGSDIYFGIYGANGNQIYKFNPTTGNATLLCTGTFGDAYGLTYKSPNLATIDQPSSSSAPSVALEFTMSGSTVSTLTLPNHYMSGIAWDAGTWWVCTYYPDPGTIYHLDASGTVLASFPPPSTQPWDICKQGSDLWVADYYANSLYKITSTGTLLESHASNGINPAGVVYDGTYLWYCDGPLGSSSTLYKVDLNSTGTPHISVPVTSHSYGAVPIGTPSSWNCQVQNTGTANLTITSIGIPGGEPITTTFTTPQTITPGNSVNVPLTYTPTAPVPLNTQVSINSSDPITPTVAVSLTGNGVYSGPHVSLPNGPHDYGTRRAGAYSRWFLQVTNDGGQTLSITDLSIDDPHFTIDGSVTLPISISPLASSKIGIWFHPEEGISYSGEVTITSNAQGQGTVTFALEGTGIDTIYPMGTPLWNFLITGGFDNSLKCIIPVPDITGDTVEDVVTGSEDNYIRCFNGNASGQGDVMWATEIPSGSVHGQKSIVTAGDIDNDGHNDIIVGTAWGDESVIALSGMTGLQIWKHDTHEYGNGGWVYQVDCRYDYNNDGFNDVLACTGNDGGGTGPIRVYCLNGKTGISIWEYPAGGPVFSVIGVSDFTGDGKPDVVAGASNFNETAGRIYGLDGTNGSLKWTYYPVGTSVWALMQLDDINNDGKKDIAAGDYSGMVLLLNAVNGMMLYHASVGPELILRLEDMGDVNKDGKRDILVAHSGTNGVIIEGKTGTVLWSVPIADQSWNVSNIGDITFDGTNDAIIGTLYQDNYAYFLNGTNGNILTSIPASNPVDAIKAIPDIVGDHTMEMVVGGRNGMVGCISGGYDTTSIPSGVKPEVASGKIRLQVYPNPSNGSYHLEIISDEDQNMTLSVTDLNGRIILTNDKIRCSRGINDYAISLPESTNPGIYMLEIQGKETVFRTKIVIAE